MVGSPVIRGAVSRLLSPFEKKPHIDEDRRQRPLHFQETTEEKATRDVPDAIPGLLTPETWVRRTHRPPNILNPANLRKTSLRRWHVAIHSIIVLISHTTLAIHAVTVIISRMTSALHIVIVLISRKTFALQTAIVAVFRTIHVPDVRSRRKQKDDRVEWRPGWNRWELDQTHVVVVLLLPGRTDVQAMSAEFRIE